MAISLKRTGTIENPWVKILITGESGHGKTRSLAHLKRKDEDNVIILSAEAGLLSLRAANLPYVEINSISDMHEAYSWLTGSAEAKGFDTVGIDSLSEVAEVVLALERKGGITGKGNGLKDPRAAYGEMQDQMSGLIRAFRDLPDHHVIMTAKVEKGLTEKGELRWTASMPGKKLTADLPYYFDEVLVVHQHRGEDGSMSNAFQCHDDGVWHAKDRSGRLAPWEPYDLAAIVDKIAGKETP
jgi:hypothetical protein